MTDELAIAFSPPSAGWINITLQSSAGKLVESFSYVRPSLTELCASLCDLGEGRPARPVVLDLEPDELELRFEPAAAGRTTLRVLGFRDQRRGPAADPSTILVHEADTRALVTAFWRALRRLETALPEDEFVRAWRKPFPTAEMKVLGMLVDSWAS